MKNYKYDCQHCGKSMRAPSLPSPTQGGPCPAPQAHQGKHAWVPDKSFNNSL